MKKIISMVSVLALTGTSFLSSVSADESMETNKNTSVSATESESSEMETTSTEEGTVATQGVSTTSEVTSTTSATQSISNNMDADRNDDNIIDMYEQCAFVQKKSESNCSSAKEAMKKKMWEQYGSGTYNPNAFERNQNNGIIMKKMNEENRMERKEMMQQKQELKKEAKITKKALSEKLRGQLTEAVEKLNVERLNKVLVNIDKAVVKIESSSLDQAKKDNFLAQLEEIRTVIQDKIDTLTGIISNGIDLNDILGGTTIDTPTATGTTTASGTVTQ